MNITVTEAVQKIESAKKTGRIFSVTFIKRTDGSQREMNCRGGVTKGLTGAGSSYDPSAYSLITVWDMQKRNYRNINCNTITRVVIDGVTFSVIP